MEGFIKTPYVLPLFANMLLDASNLELTTFARMIDGEILRRAHAASCQVYPQLAPLYQTINIPREPYVATSNPECEVKEPSAVPQTQYHKDTTKNTKEKDSKEKDSKDDESKQTTQTKQTKQAKQAKQSKQAKLITTDEDGYHHMQVCDNGSCDPAFCHFQYKPEEFPRNWIPNFCCKDKKTGKLAEGSRLIVFGISPGLGWEEAREKILSDVGDVRTASINVRAGHEYGFVTAFTHEEAVRVRKNLTTAGYSVNFFCSNLPKSKKY